MPQHVVQRGNNRQPTFYAERDYRLYLDLLRNSGIKHRCRLHHYVLMTNHVHLLLTPLHADALSATMQDVGRRYVQYVNFTYARTGTLWEGRYKANLIDAPRYFLTCCRYIEMNPVRAGMVATPQDYIWSSYRHYALGHVDPYVWPHGEYEALGTGPAERQQNYCSLFEAALDEASLQQLRGNVARGWPLGSQRFKQEIEAALQRAANPPKRGRPAKARSEM